MPSKKTGVVLMTYGSATTSDQVRPFMASVYHTPELPEEVVKEFRYRYDLVGPSPLVDLTLEQGRLLEEALSGDGVVVRVGMLHSAPSIGEAVAGLRQVGAERLVGVLLSPQYSPLIMRGYEQTLRREAEAQGYEADQVMMAGPWAEEAEFVELLSDRLEQKQRELTEKYGQPLPVVFTTHSLPERVVKRDPSYLDQLQQTISAIVGRTGLGEGSWWSAYQSAGHTPEVWLKPDLVDILAILKQRGESAVLIVPIQFLTDHLEILFDLDVAARGQAEEMGIGYYRTELPNTDDRFIRSLAAVVRGAMR